MDLLLQGLAQAARLIAAGDREVIEIARLSLEVSGLATLLALAAGVPFGVWVGLKPFPGRDLIVSLVNTGMGLPPVVVGLFVTILLWRSGPFGVLELLYTPAAIVVAQLILALPVVVGLTIAAVQQIDPRLSLQLLGLGASRAQLLVLLLREARLPLLAAVMAGFGAVISEVGASLMVGGNILHHTRVLTTATVLETSKGNFDVAIALSLILLGIAFVINLALTLIQQRATRR
jgi:tungstate transport system permease protein